MLARSTPAPTATPPAPPPGDRWHGKLDLAYERRGDRTQLVRQRLQAPLKVQRPFYPEGKEVCHTIALHTAGGIAGGDRLSQHFQLGADSRVLATTSAASKLYGSRGRSLRHPEGLEARSQFRFDLADNAAMEWLPRETIAFNGSLHCQDLRVELGQGATWLGWDILRLGRTARGERFASGWWRSRLEIWQGGVPLWVDRSYIPADPAVLDSPHGLAGQPVVASLIWAGRSVSDELLAAVRQLPPPEPGESGATRLSCGLLCRYRGPSSQAATNWFVAVWNLLRQSEGGRSARRPRVWI